jgi:cystathionine beta-lyase/cystathionine gamma-synthase
VIDPGDDRALVFAKAETLLTHDDRFERDPVVPPLYQSSLFTFSTFEEMAGAFAGERKRPIYSRGDNPTVQEFETKIAALEGAPAARAFSSGMGAISATVLAFAKSGDKIVCVNHVYGDTFRFFERMLPSLKIVVEYVDGSNTNGVVAALKGATLLYLENPTSMVFDLQDIEKITSAAREHRILSIIDNSWATPLFQQPLRHGIDIVVHSASKYLGGHSDTVAGVVAGSAQLIAEINSKTYPYLGAKLSPFEAWLLVRGLRTLPLRMKQHERHGLVLADRLKRHSDVIRVMHPVYSNHPGRATLLGFSGLFSFEVSERINIAKFANSLGIFKMGVSWGGHESLVIPAAATLQQTPGINSMSQFGVSDRTVRIHVGLENVEDLWSDIELALHAARM